MIGQEGEPPKGFLMRPNKATNTLKMDVAKIFIHINDRAKSIGLVSINACSCCVTSSLFMLYAFSTATYSGELTISIMPPSSVPLSRNWKYIHWPRANISIAWKNMVMRKKYALPKDTDFSGVARQYFRNMAVAMKGMQIMLMSKAMDSIGVILAKAKQKKLATHINPIIAPFTLA